MEATIQDHKNGVQYCLLIIFSLNFCSIDQIRTVDCFCILYRKYGLLMLKLVLCNVTN